MSSNSFGARASLKVGNKEYELYRIDALDKQGISTKHLPFSLRILLENLLRTEDGRNVTKDEIRALAAWNKNSKPEKEIAFTPSRVLLQDFTGVPAVVDLAAMRDAMKRLGGDPKLINPLQPAELVIDHSVQVDEFGTPKAIEVNALLEFQRNKELGTDWLSQSRHRAAGHRHRPSGESRISGARCFCPRRGREAHCLSRHARRHRFAHYHD
jgi:aconitate hydratase